MARPWCPRSGQHLPFSGTITCADCGRRVEVVRGRVKRHRTHDRKAVA